MILVAFGLVLSFQAAAAATPSVTADLDGDGIAETAKAKARRRKVRIVVEDSRGDTLAKADAPAPPSHKPDIRLETASLGNAGAILEVFATGEGIECRSLWRYRGGRLTHVPVQTAAGSLAECEKATEWSYRWETVPEGATISLRERSREKPEGIHRQVEAFRYAGFRLESEPSRSFSEIRGVSIPLWFAARYYRQSALEHLYSRYDLQPLRSEPHLRLLTDRSQGIFALEIRDRDSDRRLPITALESGKAENEVTLTAASQGDSARILATLTKDGSGPLEVSVQGLGPRLDHRYVPASRLRPPGLQIFLSAEHELAMGGLAGAWSSRKGDPLTVTVLSTSPPVLRFGQAEVSLSIDRAPPSTDALLIPRAGSAPTLGVSLRGPDVIARIPVACEAPSGPCRAAGAPEVFRRVGSQLNQR